MASSDEKKDVEETVADAPATSSVARLREAAKKFDAGAVAKSLEGKREIEGEAGLIAYFAEVIESLDKVGTEKLCAEMPPWEAKDVWFSLTLPQIEKRFSEWAKGNEKIKGLLSSLLDFKKENPFAYDSLWVVITDVERPCRMLKTEEELFKFLRAFLNDGLVNMAVNPRRSIEDDMVLERDKGHFAFSPRKQPPDVPKTKVQLGWQFVQKAKERIIAELDEAREKLKVMKAKGKLTPAEALADGEGKVFAPLGTTRGILFEIRGKGKNRDARVLDTAGVRVGELPSRSFDWPEAKRWSHTDIIQAIAALKREAIKS